MFFSNNFRFIGVKRGSDGDAKHRVTEVICFLVDHFFLVVRVAWGELHGTILTVCDFLLLPQMLPVDPMRVSSRNAPWKFDAWTFSWPSPWNESDDVLSCSGHCRNLPMVARVKKNVWRLSLHDLLLQNLSCLAAFLSLELFCRHRGSLHLLVS